MVRAQDASLSPKNVDNIEILLDPTKLFNDFIQSQTCNQTFSTFLDLCQAVNLRYPPSPSSCTSSYSNDHITFYPQLKKKLSSWKAQSIWAKLDKRFFGKEYFVNPKLHKSGGQRAGADTKVLIIGAGPCGLRTAIEMACLGTKVVVLEKRDNFSRNNVLHLWPFIITDLKALGAKKLYGKFCAGAIDHISIRQLQLILLKLALMLGVEIIFNVSFENLLPPVVDANDETEENIKGWTAETDPANHSISKFQFDVVIGADGKRNTLKGFERKEFRGKLAIGLTVNFINRNTTAEAKVEEISGVAYIFNQEFFKNLHRETGIDLENIVYYKGETHYFVMTAKKHSLLSKGVLKEDFDDTNKLLSYQNVDLEAMMLYAREAADFSTHHQLPSLDFAINHFGQPDVALFDFTCMYAAKNAALFRETKSHKLLSCLVGDSLLEPFWPMGTGCARGFLAAFDTAWMVKQWSLKRADLEPSDHTVELQVLAERESVYRLLHQTTPQNTVKNLAAYTIDPYTRYVNLNNKVVSPHQVTSYYVSDRPVVAPNNHTEKLVILGNADKREQQKEASQNTLTRKVSVVRSSKLLSWCRRITDGYPGVHLVDMSSSWKSGLALCALIHRFRPDLIKWNDLVLTDVEDNNQMAFDIAEKHLGISPVMTGKEMAATPSVDKLVIVTYISQFYEMFKHETPTGIPPSASDDVMEVENGETQKSPTGVNFTSPGRQNEEMSRKKKQGTFKRKDDVLPSQSLASVPEDKEKEEHKNLKNTALNEPRSMQIGNTTVKLRNKNLAPSSDAPTTAKPNVHQRASDRISALSNQLISQWEQNAPKASPKALKRQVDVSEIQVSSVSDSCYFCNRRVYIVERLSAEGHFFHRQCFVCSHCGLTLRRGTYEYVKETGKFFCDATCAADSKSCKYARKASAENITETDAGEKTFVRRYQTPERIELENIRLSMIQMPEDIPEEKLARHNFSGSFSHDELDSPEEMSDSSDEEDDIDWELVLQKASDQNQNQDMSKEWLESSIEGYDKNLTLQSWLSDRSIDPSTRYSSVDQASDESNLSVADISSDESGSLVSDAVAVAGKSSSPAFIEQNDVINDVETGRIVAGHLNSNNLAATENHSVVDSTPGPDAVKHDDSELPYEAAESAQERVKSKNSSISPKDISKKEQKPQFTVVKPRIIEKTDENSTDKSLEKLKDASLKFSKYDTLDRVQDYLRKTPLLPINIDNSTKQPIPERIARQDSSSSDTMTVSSGSEADYELFDSVDDVPSFESVNDATINSKVENHESTSNQNSSKLIHGSSRVLPRQISAEAILINATKKTQSDTTVWSNTEGDLSNTLPAVSARQKNESLDETMISEYKSCADDDITKRTPPTRKLSFDSLNRRMKFRLRARDRWLRDESNFRKPPSGSPIDRRRTPEKSEFLQQKPPTPTSPNSDMVIIEMTPSVNQPLTPTAPPKSRSHSVDADMDQYYTPLTHIPKPPLSRDATDDLAKYVNLDTTDEFVSAPSTPSDLQSLNESATKKDLPSLPKVPYLEAISPTSSANNSLTNRLDIDQKMKQTAERVKLRVEEKMKQIDKDRLTVDTNQEGLGLDASFSGYSPVPSRKKTSLKKRNKKGKSPPKGRKYSPAFTPVDDTKGGKEKKIHHVKDAVDKSDDGEKRGRNFFRMSPKKKTRKDKIETTMKPSFDSRSTLERKYPNLSDRDHAIIRGERFRITADPTTASTSKAELSDSAGEDDGNKYWAQRRRTHLQGLTPEQIDAKITRRVQLAARRQARMEAQKRLRRAQVIQRQLEEIEVKQKDLENRGVRLEKLLRGDKEMSYTDFAEQKEESNYMQDWFKLVQEKNALLRYENELMIHQRELQLEDVQSRLQQDLRERMALDDKKKSPEELAEEKEILQKMLDVVEQRDELVALLEEQRIKERDEFVDSETLLLNKFNQFPDSNWSSSPRGIPAL